MKKVEMKKVELLSDLIAAARLDRSRALELQRQERIFNAKRRTVGVDKEALDSQVQERTNKELSDANARREFENELLSNDRLACTLERRQKQDERLQKEAMVRFRRQFQPFSGRREFELNDPDLLKKQDGEYMLPGLAGEDTSSVDRVQRQREQMRGWSLQQQQELVQAKERQKLEDRQYEQCRLNWGNSALVLQKMEDMNRRATNFTVKDFNQALAAERRERLERERHQEEETNQTDILKHLQGELLSENAPGSIKAPGVPRPRRDCYKGMTPEEHQEYRNCWQQQIEERKRERLRQRQEDLQQDHARMASVHVGRLQEQQQARMSKELRVAVAQTNKHLAQAQNAEKKKKEENVPDERYFSQFNTCSR